MLNFLFSLLGEFLEAIVVSDGSLDTRKIDKNIDILRTQGWFKVIYEDEKYHRLFFTNKHIRRYLQSNYRTKRIMRSNKGREKFLMILNKQLKC
ncbi:hypothetical protein SAMN05444673_3976 [Bacillus sp. OV166]|uniref:hypothetical protein n=1 Tax=Bacillus sp. OV166 TaxID=1882763 RepID=UPI000A2AD10F|nr:hypothetical protein [Bacillus sp. OV166]SMQ80673.1 hypothetical protein SAMN05444673_3976 [Bacillus sp. OV166]